MVKLDNSKILKVGIIGPKPYFMDGHESIKRDSIKAKLCSGLENLQKLYPEKILVGITGLSLGTEQDFASCCILNKIDYLVYQILDDVESHWSGMPMSVFDNYQELKDSALKIIFLSDGNYSPKKNILRKEKIIEDSDYIFYVKYGFYPIDYHWQKMIEKYNKQIGLIDAD